SRKNRIPRHRTQPPCFLERMALTFCKEEEFRMKRYVACLVLPLLIAGCSSSKKNEAQSSPEAPAKAEEAQPAAKKTAVVPQPGDIVCKTGGDERTISVQPRESGCEVVYTKMGQANTVASAMN